MVTALGNPILGMRDVRAGGMLPGKLPQRDQCPAILFQLHLRQAKIQSGSGTAWMPWIVLEHLLKRLFCKRPAFVLVQSRGQSVVVVTFVGTHGSIHYSISPHLNHRHIRESEFAGRHFLDVALKGEGQFPRTPKLQVSLTATDGIPRASLIPDEPDDVVRVEIFYSVDPHSLTRFWRTAPATRNGRIWSARCPVISTRMPLFVMASVYYPLRTKIVGPRWNRHSPETFLVSSEALMFEPMELDLADVKATDSTERLIESDFENWQDWYRLEAGNDQHRQCLTRKIKDPKWRGPDGAALAVDVLDPAGGELAVVFKMNSWSAFKGMPAAEYYAVKPIARSNEWQTIEMTLNDLVPLDARSRQGLRTWQYMTELGIVAMVRTRQSGQSVVLAGAAWPQSRKLKNLRWTGGDYPEQFIMPGRKISPAEFDSIFDSEIRKSVEQEARDQTR